MLLTYANFERTSGVHVFHNVDTCSVYIDVGNSFRVSDPWMRNYYITGNPFRVVFTFTCSVLIPPHIWSHPRVGEQTLTHMDKDTTWIHQVMIWKPKLNKRDGIIKWKHFPRYWPLWAEFTAHRWIPLAKASDAELQYFLWSTPEQTVE